MVFFRYNCLMIYYSSYTDVDVFCMVTCLVKSRMQYSFARQMTRALVLEQV